MNFLSPVTYTDKTMIKIIEKFAYDLQPPAAPGHILYLVTDEALRKSILDKAKIKFRDKIYNFYMSTGLNFIRFVLPLVGALPPEDRFSLDEFRDEFELPEETLNHLSALSTGEAPDYTPTTIEICTSREGRIYTGFEDFLKGVREGVPAKPGPLVYDFHITYPSNDEDLVAVIVAAISKANLALADPGWPIMTRDYPHSKGVVTTDLTTEDKAGLDAFIDQLTQILKAMNYQIKEAPMFPYYLYR